MRLLKPRIAAIQIASILADLDMSWTEIESVHISRDEFSERVYASIALTNDAFLAFMQRFMLKKKSLRYSQSGELITVMFDFRGATLHTSLTSNCVPESFLEDCPEGGVIDAIELKRRAIACLYLAGRRRPITSIKED